MTTSLERINVDEMNMNDGGASGDQPSTGGGRFNDRGGYGNRPQGGGFGDRPKFPAVCTKCGKETTVPFQPTPGKPVYCIDCFREIRQDRPRRSFGGGGGGGMRREF